MRHEVSMPVLPDIAMIPFIFCMICSFSLNISFYYFCSIFVTYFVHSVLVSSLISCSHRSHLYRYEIAEDTFTNYGNILPVNNWNDAGFYSQYDATRLYTINSGDNLYVFDMSSVDPDVGYPVQEKVNTTIPVWVRTHGCLASSEITGALYVVGGQGDSKVVQIYDINSSTWSNGSSLINGRKWHDCIVEPTTQILYVVGGWGQRAVERINIMNIYNDSWEVFAQLPSDLFPAQIRIVQWYGVIFIFGGYYTNDDIDKVYTIDTVCDIIFEPCCHDQGLYFC